MFRRSRSACRSQGALIVRVEGEMSGHRVDRKSAVAAFWKWDSRRQGKSGTEWLGDRSELKDINLANAYRLSLQALGEKEEDEWVWPKEG